MIRGRPVCYVGCRLYLAVTLPPPTALYLLIGSYFYNAFHRMCGWLQPRLQILMSSSYQNHSETGSWMQCYRIGPTLEDMFYMYLGGIIKVEVRKGTESDRLPLLVVDGTRQPLFGRNWLTKIPIDWSYIKSMTCSTMGTLW